MSYVNDGTIVSIVSSDAIETAGQVVIRTDSDKTKVRLGLDAEIPFGVAFKSTEDPLNEGTYLTAETIAVQREGIAYVPLVSDNAVIAVGDPIGVASNAKNGCCDKLTWDASSSANLNASQNKLLGWAQEAAGSAAGATWPTKIKVLLDLRTA